MTTGQGFKFIALFAGIGGLRIGFEAIGGTCVFTSEWNKFLQETYRANFEDDSHEVNGDITAINEADIPAHDVLACGFSLSAVLHRWCIEKGLSWSCARFCG
jgi:DNA (cytosine-5)-methyltransferase 1